MDEKLKQFGIIVENLEKNLSKKFGKKFVILGSEHCPKGKKIYMHCLFKNMQNEILNLLIVFFESKYFIAIPVDCTTNDLVDVIESCQFDGKNLINIPKNQNKNFKMINLTDLGESDWINKR